jgi:hypothetical protein
MKNITKKILMVVILLTTMYFFSKGQTPVGGGIYSNTTWSLANSPYIVTDTVVVFPGVTLTIEPGVTVKFENNMVLEIRQANIIAIGTNSDSITFTSNSANPNINDWGKIYLNESKNTIFKFCSFKYANQGLYILDNYYAPTDTLTISNSNFEYNNFGVRCWRLSRYHQYDSCNFINNNEGFSIEYFTDNAKAFFNNCNFSNNSVSGFDGTYYNLEKIYLKNCIISFNNSFGVKGALVDSCLIYNNGIGIELSPKITNSIIKNNNHGINGSDSVINCTINNNSIGVSAYEILNCMIDSNLVYGVYSYGNVTNCQINNNNVGIYIYDSTHSITRNFIENNNIGIELNEHNNIYCNKICNNIQYNLKYTNASNFDVSNNYWCTLDSAAITMGIYDGYDDVNSGIITFMPIDTSQCYLDGCALIITATVTNATCDTCHNGSATGHVANGFAPYTWTWYSSPIQTEQTATGLAPGTYSLCVTDGNGCTACNPSIFIDSTNCTGFSIVAHSTNATCSTCTDGEAWVDIYGGSPPYSYTWYSIPMQNTPSVDNLGQGSYEVCVSDLYGCIQCDSVDIGVGDCSAYFYLYADTAISHHYYAVNMASGVTPLTYSWDWGDGNVSDGPYPSHTYANEGNYTICLSITDFVGCTNTHCVSFYLQKDGMSTVTVDVISDSPTEINDNIKDQTFSIFPNPVNDYLTIRLLEDKPTGEIKIYNLLGQQYRKLTISDVETKLDVSDFLNGVYILDLITNKNIYRQRFIKQ